MRIRGRTSLIESSCVLGVAIMAFVATHARAQSFEDAQPHANVVHDAIAVGALLPYGRAGALQGFRAIAVVDSAYDGIRDGSVERVRGEVVVVPRRVSLFGGGKYGAPDVSVSPRFAGEGGVRLQTFDQERHGIDLIATLGFTTLGFNQLPAATADLSVSRAFGRVRFTFDAEYGQSTREGDRYGSVDLSALVRATSTLHAGLDARGRTDLERDGSEPTFEPQYEVVGSALIGYVAPWLAVQLRGGVRALQYRLQTDRRIGPEVGVTVATAL